MKDITLFRPGGYELTRKAARITALHGAVLDVGCGLGGTLDMLSEEFGIEPHGVDVSGETVKRAGKDYIIRADALALPFEAESFQGIIFECSLSLISDPFKALGEAARVLSPGGVLIISTLTAESCDVLVDRGRISLQELRSALASLGFGDITVSDETAALRSFIGNIIFEYNSLAAYAKACRAALGSCALDCSVPSRGTGYALITAKKLDN